MQYINIHFISIDNKLLIDNNVLIDLVTLTSNLIRINGFD